MDIDSIRSSESSHILGRMSLNRTIGGTPLAIEDPIVGGPEISRVLIIYCGGTLGMKWNDILGYIPIPGYLFQKLESMSQFHDTVAANNLCSNLYDASAASAEFSPFTQNSQNSFDQDYIYPHDLPLNDYHTSISKFLVTPKSIYNKHTAYQILEYDPLIDSASMNMSDWSKLASDISYFYKYYDGFIIIHGTDTMAYTASALSFMLENLGKTVILTGSQIPITEMRNDASENLMGALTIAGHYLIPEVSLFFGNKLFRGNRASKINAADFHAFDSLNMRPLAELNIQIWVAWSEVYRSDTLACMVPHLRMCSDIMTLSLFPGIPVNFINCILSSNTLKGVILETFGVGNAPLNRPDLMSVFRVATSERDIVIVNISQCPKGMIRGDVYATGRQMLEAGITPGYNMTLEAALTKLSYLLGKGFSAKKVRQLMSVNLRGELEVPLAAQKFSNALSLTSSVGDAHVILIENMITAFVHSLSSNLYLPSTPSETEGKEIDLTDKIKDSLMLSSSQQSLLLSNLTRGSNLNTHEEVRSLLWPIVSSYFVSSGNLQSLVEFESYLKNNGTVNSVNYFRNVDEAAEYLADAENSCIRRIYGIIQEDSGYTLLHLAAIHGHSSIVTYLLKKGLSVHATDRTGKTPLELALLNHRWDAAAILVKTGAKLRRRKSYLYALLINFVICLDFSNMQLLLDAGLERKNFSDTQINCLQVVVDSCNNSKLNETLASLLLSSGQKDI